VPPTESVRPLQDVWLRPRRVVRELSTHPLGITDYLLGAAQGVASWLALSRAQDLGASKTVEEILARAFVIGPLLGVASLFVLAAIYARLANRAGTGPTLTQVFHVLAYGGVPIVASLGIWLLTALLVGEPVFVNVPRPELEGFAAFLIEAQFIAQALLFFWSLVLQVMGLSELQGLTAGRAFWVWLLGQFLGVLAMTLLAIVLLSLGLFTVG
jgi:Yip1-like protein